MTDRWSVQAAQNQFGEVSLTTDAVGGFSTPTSAVMTNLLVPTFSPVTPWLVNPLTIQQVGVRVGTGLAASTIGAAIYSILYTGVQTFTATLVAQLNASISGAAAALVWGGLTTGAPASGATGVTLDCVNNAYIVGTMASTVTTLALWGSSPNSALGCLALTSGARSSVTDWPASFTQASVAAVAAANRVNQVFARTSLATNWF